MVTVSFIDWSNYRNDLKDCDTCISNVRTRKFHGVQNNVFQYVTLTSSGDVTPTSSIYQQRKFPLTDTLLRHVLATSSRHDSANFQSQSSMRQMPNSPFSNTDTRKNKNLRLTIQPGTGISGLTTQ